MLQIAIQLDPDYSDAMAYMNLLYRIEAGIADTPAQSADAVAKADSWVDQGAGRQTTAGAESPAAPGHWTWMDRHRAVHRTAASSATTAAGREPGRMEAPGAIRVLR